MTQSCLIQFVDSTDLTVGVLPVLVPLLVLRQSVIRLCAHRLGQVTECLWIVQV